MPAERLMSTFVSGFPLLAGLLLLVMTLQSSINAEGAATWRQTKGVVVEEGSHASYGLFTGHLRERLNRFSYRYEVDGIAYTNSRINLAALSIGKDYRRGEPVVVYYDPAMPSEAALEVGVSIVHLFAYGVAIGLIGVSVVLRRRLAEN